MTLFDGSFHEVDSSELAFKIAGSMGFKEGAKRAQPVLLEPIMAVEVIVPEDFIGEVSGDLSSRRGKITDLEARNWLAGGQGQSASGGDVRVCHPAPFQHPGPGHLYDAVFPL